MARVDLAAPAEVVSAAHMGPVAPPGHQDRTAPRLEAQAPVVHQELQVTEQVARAEHLVLQGQTDHQALQGLGSMAATGLQERLDQQVRMAPAEPVAMGHPALQEQAV